MKASRLKGYRLLLSLLAIIATFVIVQSPWGERLNLGFLDVLTRYQAKDRAPSDIVIVDIDDASLQQVAPWPWPRSLMASLLEKLFREHAVKGVALDVVFPESKDRAGDRYLANVAKAHNLCLAQAFDVHAPGRRIGMLAQPARVDIARPLPATGYVGNFPALAHAAHCSGHITPHADADGVVRRMPAGFRLGNRTWPWLAGALTARSVAEPVRVSYLPIPYRHAPSSWRAVSAQEVLSDKLPPRFLDGAWILVGSTALGLNDAVVSPLGNWTPGIVLHAELLDARLRPLPAPVPFLGALPWLALGILALGTVWAIHRERLRGAVVFLAAGNGAWLFGADMLWQARQDFAAIAPALGSFLLLLILLPFEWQWVLRRHWRLARLFKGYLAPVVVDRLLAADDQGVDVLTPQRREITVMFADIEGFTRLSRQLPTDRLAQLTRAVLELLTREVHRYEGTVDKYIGDAVMAIWNAPLDQPDHADRAMQCALSMVEALEKWNGMHPNMPDVNIHIAINTGEAMVGDLGTSLRHAYTAIGHTVNQADRLLGCARTAGRQIVASSATASCWSCAYDEEAYCICHCEMDCLPPDQ